MLGLQLFIRGNSIFYRFAQPIHHMIYTSCPFLHIGKTRDCFIAPIFGIGHSFFYLSTIIDDLQGFHKISAPFIKGNAFDAHRHHRRSSCEAPTMLCTAQICIRGRETDKPYLRYPSVRCCPLPTDSGSSGS